MQILMEEQTTRVFDAGEELPKTSNYLWLITDGVVKKYTSISTETGKRIITLGFWGQEDVVGESLSKVSPYSLKCLSRVEAIALPRSQWQTVAPNLLNHREQMQQLMYIVQHSRIDRQLWLLLEYLANKFGQVIQQGKLISFKLTAQDLADVLGADLITVARVLNQFEEEDLIVRQAKSIIVQD